MKYFSLGWKVQAPSLPLAFQSMCESNYRLAVRLAILTPCYSDKREYFTLRGYGGPKMKYFSLGWYGGPAMRILAKGS